MAKESQEKECLDCGESFRGNPRARYCPRCRELRKSGTTFHEARISRPGPFKRLGAKIEPIKKYLSFWRLVTINIILLVFGFICVWYLKNQPYSYETQQKLEAFAPSNLALTVMLVWGTLMRVFYWWRENKSDNSTFWKEGYWKQLTAWLFGIIFTEFWGLFFLLT